MKNQYLTKFVFVLFVLAFGISCYYYGKTKDLKQQLEAQKIEQQNLMNAKSVDGQELTQIDAMIIDGDDYSGALKAYQEKFGEDEAMEGTELELRISLTKKLLQLKARPEKDSAQLAQMELLDSLKTLADVSPKEIQQFDSLSFVLEKAKARIARMQRQLRQKSSGQYLTFSNSKGSQMHYVGEVKNGKANGFGVAILNTGSRYIGEWKDNERHGEGSFYWHDGQYYVGAYKNDKRSGKGTYHWPNGEKFVGLWKDDERTGEGAFFGKKGDVVASGVWEHDELVVTNKP
ncbi:MORN repeat-containing protein [Flagellimonas flava]|uniref:Uncharacterized conserved protein n=1 Tax=Flagellimonas flava TaxID=570519 RepID=A0A1M5IP32_9FLAO|nr:hypothetical protein [Allomuricauda flava]SHG29710.1 Uncharacterized conserved protein [Allomuricauda flava]